MQIKPFHGYPDYVGRRMIFAGTVQGPASLAAGGDKLDPFRKTMKYDAVYGGLSVDGMFRLDFKPSSAAVRADWYGQYSFVSGGSVWQALEIQPGSGMTPGTYTINGTGGGPGTGAQLAVTVNATDVTNLVILNPGKGYTSAPAFSLAAAGGNPAQLQSILSQPGYPVSPGSNLSTSQFIISGFCGQY